VSHDGSSTATARSWRIFRKSLGQFPAIVDWGLAVASHIQALRTYSRTNTPRQARVRPSCVLANGLFGLLEGGLNVALLSARGIRSDLTGITPISGP
jgi:hypothetical protein